MIGDERICDGYRNAMMQSLLQHVSLFCWAYCLAWTGNWFHYQLLLLSNVFVNLSIRCNPMLECSLTSASWRDCISKLCIVRYVWDVGIHQLRICGRHSNSSQLTLARINYSSLPAKREQFSRRLIFSAISLSSTSSPSRQSIQQLQISYHLHYIR